jgi:hypothetical protein
MDEKGRAQAPTDSPIRGILCVQALNHCRNALLPYCLAEATTRSPIRSSSHQDPSGFFR